MAGLQPGHRSLQVRPVQHPCRSIWARRAAARTARRPPSATPRRCSSSRSARPACRPRPSSWAAGKPPCRRTRRCRPSTTETTHEFQVDVEKAGVLVTAAYGPNEPGLRSILAGAKDLQHQRPRVRLRCAGQVGGNGQVGGGPTADGRRLVHRSQVGTSATAAKSATSATSAMQPSPPRRSRVSPRRTSSSATSSSSAATSAAITGMVGAGLAFDTCTAPSTSTMSSWLASPYRVMGTYLGGMNWACSYGNFTASWVSHTAAEGWRFAPLWVGRQASCWPSRRLELNPLDRRRRGALGSRDAVSANALGLRPGSPIYFDMEGYDAGGSCGRAVVSFLGGWTRNCTRTATSRASTPAPRPGSGIWWRPTRAAALRARTTSGPPTGTASRRRPTPSCPDLDGRTISGCTSTPEPTTRSGAAPRWTSTRTRPTGRWPARFRWRIPPPRPRAPRRPS